MDPGEGGVWKHCATIHLATTERRRELSETDAVLTVGTVFWLRGVDRERGVRMTEL